MKIWLVPVLAKQCTIFKIKIKTAKKKSGILLPKLFRPTVRKNCSNDQEKRLKFEAEG